MRAAVLSRSAATFDCPIGALRFSRLVYRMVPVDRSRTSADGSQTVVTHGTAPLVDTGRGGGKAPAHPGERFASMLERLGNDPLWSDEYDEFVHNVSFAGPNEVISFAAALEAAKGLANRADKEKGVSK
jgi:hypothetical protein